MKLIVSVFSLKTPLLKFILMMKMIVFLLIASCIQVQAAGQKMSISKTNAPLKEIFKSIEKQSGYLFMYESGLIKPEMKATLKVHNAEIDQVMNECLSGTSLGFTIVGRSILLKKKPVAEVLIIRSIEEKEVFSRTITGKVLDAKGNPLVGVSVTVKGTMNGTSTNTQGEYELDKVNENDILLFSMVGYKTINVTVKEGLVYDVVLVVQEKQQDEIIITGIFNRKAESFTGAATVINKTELMRSGSVNLLQNISNIDPSFKIIENIDFGSNPNRMPDIQMRGQQSIPDLKGSFDGNPNQPLFILDGFETGIETVFDLDMNRVENIVLLKDAAAKAIYGSKAANGVVVIETRKPRPGKLNVSYKGDLNITVPDLTGYNLTNSSEKYVVERDNTSLEGYFFFFNEQYLNNIQKQVARGVNTYWLAKPLTTGVGNRHSVFMEGGDENLRYGIDLMYNNNAGVMKGSKRNTFTGNFTFSYKYKSLLLRNQFSVSENRSDDSPYGTFSEYVALNPYWEPYDADGNIKQIAGTIGGGGFFETRIGNPLWNASVRTQNASEYTKLTNNFYLEWEIRKSLRLRGRLGLTKDQSLREDFFPASHTRFANYDISRYSERGSYSKGIGESSNVNSDLNLNYSVLADKHQMFFNIGVNMREDRSEYISHHVIGFPNERLDFMGAGLGYILNSRPSGNEAITRELGGLAVMNYSYDNRFLADISIRSTGSSMFGTEKRWGQFWSAGAGWNIHQESLFRNYSWLKQFKVRASTGFTGAQNFNPYQALATFAYYQSDVYDNWLGTYLLGLPNTDLKWQKTRDLNIGTDINLFGRIFMRYDYYIQNTSDQLLDLTIPPSMGFNSYKENLGSTRNKGMELKISARILEGSSKNNYLNLSGSIARNENKILEISNALRSYNDANDKELVEGDRNKRNRPLVYFKEGQSLNAIWAVRSLGIDPATGDEIFLSKDGKLTSEWNVADQVVIGDAMPKYLGNFGTNASWKGFFFDLSFNYRFGGQIYNKTLVDRVENAYVQLNVDKRIFNAVWKKPDDIVAFSFQEYRITRPTSRFVQDLNELRLSLINFGYDFRDHSLLKRTGLNQLRANFYMNDVFRISSVKIERGLDYPFARTYSLSIQASF